MSNPIQVPSGTDVNALKDADFVRVSDIEKAFKFFKKSNDPRFGEVSIIQNPETRQLLGVKEKKISDRKEAGQNIVYARKRIALRHPYLLNLVDYSVIKQSELCSSFYIIKFFFEFPKTDLRRELQDRDKIGEAFSDIELTHMLYHQVQAANFLHTKDIFHGDIQPLNVGYDRDSQNFKLIEKFEDASNAPNRIKQFQKNRLISGQPLYQSPETYANLKKGNLNFNLEPAKEDSFGLGLTLLEAGNSHSIQNIYDAKNGVVSKENLNQHLQQFQNRFGGPNSILPKSVASLLAYEPKDRLTIHELDSRLPAYDQVKQSLENLKRNPNAEPIVLESIIPHASIGSYPQLFDSNVKYTKVESNLEANPYTNYVNQNNEPRHYTFVHSEPQQVQQQQYVIYGNDQNGNNQPKDVSNDYSYTQPTNITFVSYGQPSYGNYSYQHPNAEQVVYANPVDPQQLQSRIVKETVTSDIVSNQVNVQGLKLVKTYIDPSNATDRPNH